MTLSCPHGDATCPCPDGDPCHYEGLGAWMCPNPPPTVINGWITGLSELGEPLDSQPLYDGRAHCHVEGCRWTEGERAEVCGLIQLGTPLRGANRARLRDLRDTPWWRCGAIRLVAESGINRGPSPG